MENISRIEGGVAHEFNNLLTVIHGAIEELRRRPGEEEERGHIDDLDGTGERLREDNFIAKPFGKEELLGKIRIRLAARRDRVLGAVAS